MRFAVAVVALAAMAGCPDRRKPIVVRGDLGPAVVVVDPRKVPPAPKLPLIDEKEPDDDREHAQPLEPGKGVKGTLGPPHAVKGQVPPAVSPGVVSAGVVSAGVVSAVSAGVVSAGVVSVGDVSDGDVSAAVSALDVSPLPDLSSSSQAGAAMATIKRRLSFGMRVVCLVAPRSSIRQSLISVCRGS